MTIQEVSVDDLTMSIEEAEETLRAIRSGHVDALVTSDGDSAHIVALRSPADVRLDLILEASVLLNSSLDYRTTLSRLARFLVERLADWCLIDVIDESDSPRAAAMAHVDPTKLALVDELYRRYPPHRDPEVFGRTLRTGESFFCPIVLEDHFVAIAHDEEHLRLLQEVGMTSAVVVGLKVGDRILGAMSLMFTTSGRRYTDGDLKVVEKLASHAALAIDNARLYAAEREARKEAERAARRVERMQTLTSALAASLGMADIGVLIVRESLAVLGAQGGTLATLTPDGQALEVVDAQGYAEDLMARWRGPLAISMPLPLCDAARTRKLVTCNTIEDFGYYPLLDKTGVHAPANALLAAPLVFEGRVLGALGMTFDQPRSFSAEELVFVETLARQCAQALEGARLSGAERRARLETEMLYTLVDAVSRAEGLEDVFAPAMDAVARALGTERSVIVLLDQDGAMRVKASRGLSEVYCDALQASAPWSRHDLRTPLLVEDVACDERIGPFGTVLAEEGIRAIASFPLLHHGAVIGKLTSYANERRVFSSAAVRLATTIAGQVAQAVGKRLSEAENARLYAETEAANRMKDEFLAVVSHELRTPLAAISGWATILRGPRGKDPVAAQKGLEVIDRNAKAQAKLIDDILDVSRIITGKLVVDPRPVSLVAVVCEALDTIRASASAKKISVAFPLDDDAFTVVGDPDRLRQIAWNLLSNAIKFTASGGRVEVRIERVDGGVMLEVSDTGKGIAPAFLPHVFERFRQADGSTTRQDSGIGLGLAIVRHLVELHGGQVHASSPGPGEGATFRVVLPVRALFSEPPPDSRTAPRGPLHTAAHLDLSGVRVLLIDDQPDARELVVELLSSLGAVVDVAGSVTEALEAMHRFSPDVLVSDIGMPSQDGYSLIRSIRALPAPLGNVPAMALTAYARSEDADKAKAAGFDCHVAKPTSSHSLACALVDLLGSRDW